MGCSLPGSSVHGIFQARVLEWGAIAFSSPSLYKFKKRFLLKFCVAMMTPSSTWSSVQFSSVQSLSRVWLFETPWTAARQASLSITNSWNELRLMSIKLVMPSNHLISVIPFSCLQSFPASGSFPVSQFFTLGGKVLEFQVQHQSFLFRTDFL